MIPCRGLSHLVAEEANPHHLIVRVAADSSLLKEVRRLCGEMPGAESAACRRLAEGCRTGKIAPEYFHERLQLIARILNLIPSDRNYYEILAVDRSAGREEIKQAFRRLSFSAHPDTNPGDPAAAARFRDLQHAFEVLSNDKLRQSYDHNLETRSWADEEIPEEGPGNHARWSKWRRAWPVGAILALLILLSSMIDYRKWQTERFYATEPGAGKPPALDAENAAQMTPQAPKTPYRAGVKPAPTDPVKDSEPSEGAALTPTRNGVGAGFTPARVEGEEPKSRRLRPHRRAASTVQRQDIDGEIRTFLSRFTRAYEAKDPAALLRFFEADAVENGMPVENLMPVHEANFMRAEKLRYRIEVGRWEMGEISAGGREP